MSIFSALNTATSALYAQSKAFTSISSNISNSSSTGYKATDTSFTALLTDSQTSSADYGGVIAGTTQTVSSQGDITSTDVTTNLALDGDGMFVVNDGSSTQAYYTRDGSFSENNSGYLVNTEGFYLEGWATDDSGNILATNRSDTASLEKINLDDISGSPKATTKVTSSLNLPSDATVGSSYTTDTEVYDSLGNSSTVTMTWTKTGTNTWELDASNPVSATDGSTVTGTTSGTPVSLVFNSDGSLASPTTDIQLGITGWSSGATDSTITLDYGENGGSGSITQYASGSTTPSVTTTGTPKQDGYAKGTLSSVDINTDGSVVANFDNGQSKTVYKIPVATFANADGLTAVSGQTYAQSTASGTYSLKEAGSDGAGTIESKSLESSNVDVSDELSRMIYAQQAYSAAAKVVSTAQDMMDTLLQAKR
ncbi:MULTISPECIES: flagellar hook protein FlgE [Nitrospirillum]|uniref:Flagellar hook protein FlgE n=2 Tax=Nitrospirillum TaxID=1543705 RepID=A0A248JWJ0_9PROT|nr:flagellar hook protein FlgE [Nitrospirillum amazonense]ASG23093.1 flagellar hook protein FlgE [Nitrospirillum amazonense CBAmc]MEC4595140.1 flagellar hook protein FlgE [Nitrospirillum amazonense]TWB22871.1 flagellar hook protein FlgE [Nitrospirillum amazonense]TWB38828.1 flagellar hook protein FlgE [Nitrospirillum amazonense]